MAKKKVKNEICLSEADCPHVKNENKLEKELQVQQKENHKLIKKIERLNLILEENDKYDLNDEVMKIKIEQATKQKEETINKLLKEKQDLKEELWRVEENNKGLRFEVDKRKNEFELKEEIRVLSAKTAQKREELNVLTTKFEKVKADWELLVVKKNQDKIDNDLEVDKFNILREKNSRLREKYNKLVVEAEKLGIKVKKRKAKFEKKLDKIRKKRFGLFKKKGMIDEDYSC